MTRMLPAPSDPSVHSSSSSKRKRTSDSADESDTPALSHAAKRRRKKAERRREASEHTSTSTKKTTFQEGDGASATVEAADRSTNVLPKRQNSVWVGNLSFKTTVEGLKSFFDGVGEITRVHLPNKLVGGGSGGHARQENRGFAYVDFATSDAKIVAITLSEQHLDGRKLLIKDGDDFSGRPENDSGAHAGAMQGRPTVTGLTKTAQKILKNQKQPPTLTLFIGNLGFEATEDTIRELFEAHRKAEKDVKDSGESGNWIRKIRMGTFEDSGRCKGWAFVDFSSIQHASGALTNPRNHHLNGRDLIVEYASPEAVRRGGGMLDSKKSSVKKGAQPVRKQESSLQKPSGTESEHIEPTTPSVIVQRAREPQSEKSHKDKGKRHRPAPGSALALAKRESLAIVPSQGTKITFDC